MPEKGQNEPGWRFLTGYDRLKAIISEHLENPISVIGPSTGNNSFLYAHYHFNQYSLKIKTEKKEKKNVRIQV